MVASFYSNSGVEIGINDYGWQVCCQVSKWYIRPVVQ